MSARLTRAGWLPRGGLWIDPASGRSLTERAALRCHERDVARGDTDAVEAELATDTDYLALLDARDAVELADDEALARLAPCTEADLFAAGAPWVAA